MSYPACFSFDVAKKLKRKVETNILIWVQTLIVFISDSMDSLLEKQCLQTRVEKYEKLKIMHCSIQVNDFIQIINWS